VLSLKIYISFLSRLAQRQRRHGKVLYTLAAVWESAAGGKKTTQKGKPPQLRIPSRMREAFACAVCVFVRARIVE